MLQVLLPALLLLPTPARDAPAEVDDWCTTFERDRRAEQEDLASLEPLLIDLRGYGRLSRAHRARAARSLLDLYGMGLSASRGSDRDRAVLGWSLLLLAEREFQGLADAELLRWAAEEVLVVASLNPIQRRAAAAHLLAGVAEPGVLQGLKICARDEDPNLRLAAFEALVGVEDPGVHRLFAQVLWRADATTPSHLLGAAEAHLRAIRLPQDSPVVELLEGYVLERIGQDSWRRASRAAAVSAALPDEKAVPLLIYGMKHWETLDKDQHPVLRVKYDISRELASRSGLELGLQPKRWSTWWEATRGGQARPVGAAPAQTSASFFGLRPSTDRIIFVLDRSGSMGQPFEGPQRTGNRTWSRHDEALTQMVSYLEALGPGARFNLVLFADGATAWRRGLQPASKAHLRAVEAWARRRPPEGGTQLRHGVELALGLATDGSLDLESLEADTLVVLCDGRTDEGQNWVQPILRRVNPRARVLIHGVQIGEGGDGTLDLLAHSTGGEFVRVED